jgi:glucose/mannose-6-phosphate isomerase
VPCKKIAITTGGKLKQAAEKAKVPVFSIDHVSPPRAALGYSFMPLLAFLQNLGVFSPDEFDVEAMVLGLESLMCLVSETVPLKSNMAKQLATAVCGKIVIIYGAGIISEVARRWKTQINENSKAWAFYEIFPELNHNAVVGYEFPKEMLANLHVVLLRSPFLHPRILLRYQITAELLQKNAVNYRIIDGEGDDELSGMMKTILLGDWVSYYLALLNQIDPTPVNVIDYLKEKLGSNR